VRVCKSKFLREIAKGVEIAKCIRKRCLRPLALTAERNVKFHSSQTEAGQYTAESAIANEDHHEDTKL